MRLSRVAGCRPGFTLIELMLALTLGASIVLAGRAIFERVGDAGRTIARRSAEMDAERVTSDALRALFRSAGAAGTVGTVGTAADTTVRFQGDNRRAQFTSWCTSEATPPSRCVVTMTVDTSLRVSRTPGTPLVLAGPGLPGSLRYLADSRGGGRWRTTWGDTPDTPLAVAVIFGNDTTVFRTGQLE